MHSSRRTSLQPSMQGPLLVNYVGHGSVEVWRGDIFTSPDAAALTNGNKLPIVVAMTCLNGLFQDIYSESLAEALLRAPQRRGHSCLGIVRAD